VRFRDGVPDVPKGFLDEENLLGCMHFVLQLLDQGCMHCEFHLRDLGAICALRQKLLHEQIYFGFCFLPI